MPLSDGAEGAADVAALYIDGEVRIRRVTGPLGEPVDARYLIATDGFALVTTASASGLALVPAESRQPMWSTTWGLGELIAYALDDGAQRLVIAAGGSATTDMGAGTLAALGARFLDADGHGISPFPAALAGVDVADLTRLDPRLATIRADVISDVDTPLGRNLTVFGRQKGFTSRDAPLLTRALVRMARTFGAAAEQIFEQRWLGAGGGVAAGLAAALGVHPRSASDWFLDATGAREAIAESDLVLTAEGRFDRGSLAGKLPVAVARAAAERGVPAVVVAATTDSAADLDPPAYVFDLSLEPLESGDRVDEPLAAALRQAAARAVRVRDALAAGRARRWELS